MIAANRSPVYNTYAYRKKKKTIKTNSQILLAFS